MSASCKVFLRDKEFNYETNLIFLQNTVRMGFMHGEPSASDTMLELASRTAALCDSVTQTLHEAEKFCPAEIGGLFSETAKDLFLL